MFDFLFVRVYHLNFKLPVLLRIYLQCYCKESVGFDMLDPRNSLTVSLLLITCSSLQRPSLRYSLCQVVVTALIKLEE